MYTLCQMAGLPFFPTAHRLNLCLKLHLKSQLSSETSFDQLQQESGIISTSSHSSFMVLITQYHHYLSTSLNPWLVSSFRPGMVSHWGLFWLTQRKGSIHDCFVNQQWADRWTGEERALGFKSQELYLSHSYTEHHCIKDTILWDM